MPRDITHWLLAADTAALVPADSFYGAAARDRPALRALGAVLHDVLYYAPPALSRFAWLANQLHCEAGEDSFAPVRALHQAVHELRAASSPLAADLGAFLVGFVTHVHVDATFHPLVYYHTGLPDPNGRMSSTVAQAHRRLEALIDLHFVGSLSALDKYSLRSYLAEAGTCAQLLTLIVARVLVDPGKRAELATTLAASWARFGRAQAVFRRRPLAGAAYALRRLWPDWGREIVALGYAPMLRTLLPRVAGAIEFRHPVTGAPGSTSLATLRWTATAAAVATLARLEATPRAAAPLAGEVGPTLEAGLPGVGAAALVHCAPERLVPL
jgi:hypothetical protein